MNLRPEEIWRECLETSQRLERENPGIGKRLRAALEPEFSELVEKIHNELEKDGPRPEVYDQTTGV